MLMQRKRKGPYLHLLCRELKLIPAASSGCCAFDLNICARRSSRFCSLIKGWLRAVRKGTGRKFVPAKQGQPCLRL